MIWVIENAVLNVELACVWLVFFRKKVEQMAAKQTVVRIVQVSFLSMLVGCKIHIDIPIKMSMLKVGSTTATPAASGPVINATLRAEIPSCHDFGDSRKPSSSLLETKSKIPSIFKGAEFKECYSKNFVTFAEFSVPVVLDKNKDGKFTSDDFINIISLDRQILSVYIPRSIRTQLQLFRNDSFTADQLEPIVSIYLENDIGRDVKAFLVGVYVSDEPFHMGTVTLHKNQTFVVRLSDVATDYAIKGGISSVILDPNTTIK